MIFQVLFTALTAATMFYFLIATRRSALRRLFVLFFFGAGILFILDPDLSTRIANLVGIGRGADLIFYVSTLFLFFLCFNYYLHFRSLEEQLTHVVREMAVQNPVRDEDPARQR
jgi:hypothetical protein